MDIFDILWNGYAPNPSVICGAEDDPPPGDGGSGLEGNLTDDVKKEIARTVNSALSHRLQRMDFEGMVNKALSEQIPAAIEGVIGSVQPPQPSGVDDPPKPGDIHKHPDYIALQKRTEALERQSKEREQRELERDRQEKVNNERSALQQALLDNQVPSTRVRGAIALLHGEYKRIATNDQGQIVYRAQRDGYVDELSIADGIKEFLSTDEGKTYLPPVNAKGSGETGGTVNPRTAPKPGEKLTGAARMQALGESLLGLGNPTGGGGQ